MRFRHVVSSFKPASVTCVSGRWSTVRLLNVVSSFIPASVTARGRWRTNSSTVSTATWLPSRNVNKTPPSPRCYHTATTACHGLPVRSQTGTVLSQLPVTRRFPLGLKASTQPVPPCDLARQAAVLIQELFADVLVEHGLAVVQLADDGVDLADPFVQLLRRNRPLLDLGRPR